MPVFDHVTEMEGNLSLCFKHHFYYPIYMKSISLLLIILLLTSACSPGPIFSTQILPTLAATASPLPTDQQKTLPQDCELDPVIAPTIPAIIPGYAELDETTGLHMTGIVQEIDLSSYRLKVSGKVDHPLTVSYDELRCMPRVTAEPTLVCVGFFEDVAAWSGVSLVYLLDLAGVQDEAERIKLVSADGYRAILTIEEALHEENFLAYEWEGQPLPILHGFPVRLIAPMINGNYWVKWLVEIAVE